MPIIKNPPKKKAKLPYMQAKPPADIRYKMRIYRPGRLSPVEKFYKSLEQLKRYQRYYRDQGVKTRRLTVV